MDAAICSRFAVDVAPREEVGFVLERLVDPGDDVRDAVHAVLDAAREHELPLDGA